MASSCELYLELVGRIPAFLISFIACTYRTGSFTLLPLSSGRISLSKGNVEKIAPRPNCLCRQSHMSNIPFHGFLSGSKYWSNVWVLSALRWLSQCNCPRPPFFRLNTAVGNLTFGLGFFGEPNWSILQDGSLPQISTCRSLLTASIISGGIASVEAEYL